MAGAWYGVPWWISNCADRAMTLTSGCPCPVHAIQPSGTIRAPHRLTTSARSTPRARQASADMAAAT